ncbi:putative cytoplasmic protein [Desulfarculus baarsii DSM 2075]|uniref:Cytoplasmic protein n=1 Tax=Desulfarculus baarsii (strain ATCC 33931 / DSM 2075 / LMG 7858 / VKM B-1802 / 2st14) TaxID=644282 RepID=E1QGF7_DESB2|nr:cell division protein ZapB [Desulfarculus baarsii]ADK83669.1 putative cytoplasmic protein [Desulfarculus baarsii DSM 2075]
MEIAVFARLEQKVEALLERLAALKEENSELMKLYNEKDSEATELKRQLAAQEAEREQVRQRIENLVAKLEQI